MVHNIRFSKVELMLLLALLKRLKSFRLFLSCFQIIEFTRRYRCYNMLIWNTTINFTDMWKVFMGLSTGKPLYYSSTQPFQQKKRENKMALIAAQNLAEMAQLKQEMLRQDSIEGNTSADQITSKVSVHLPSFKHWYPCSYWLRK